MSEFEQKRIECGLTQKEVANYLGVSRNTVYRWEIGQTQPSPEYQRKLDELFCAVKEQMTPKEVLSLSHSEEMTANVLPLSDGKPSLPPIKRSFLPFGMFLLLSLFPIVVETHNVAFLLPMPIFGLIKIFGTNVSPNYFAYDVFFVQAERLFSGRNSFVTSLLEFYCFYPVTIWFFVLYFVVFVVSFVLLILDLFPRFKHQKIVVRMIELFLFLNLLYFIFNCLLCVFGVQSFLALLPWYQVAWYYCYTIFVLFRLMKLIFCVVISKRRKKSSY